MSERDIGQEILDGVREIKEHRETLRIYKIDHIQIAMPPGEEDAARAFYVGVLGFTEVAKPEGLAGRGGAWFEQGAVRLHLGVEPDFRPSQKAHPALLTDDLPALLERCKEYGVEITRDVLLAGYDRAHIRDPFGNRIELMQVLSRAKYLSENRHVAQDAGASELDQGQPIAGLLTPAGANGAPLR